MRLFCEVGSVQIYHGDARHLTETLTEPVSLIVTSPPYNVGIPYAGHDDNMAAAAYARLLLEAWHGCGCVMAEGARLCVVVPAGVGRRPWKPLAETVRRTLAAFRGLEIEGEIVWDKGMTGNRCTWGSWRLPTSPALRDRTERIIIARRVSTDPQAKPRPLAVPDEALSVDTEGRRVSPWLDAETFMRLTQDLWAIPPEAATRIGHPAPFPVKLVENLLRLYGFPGCHVLDPFAGSGTVGVAAIRLGCRATLVDIDAAYCDLAARRCAGVRPLLLQEVSTP
jgi:site-specific DNA-methyltransferase (adenine-specific)